MCEAEKGLLRTLPSRSCLASVYRGNVCRTVLFAQNITVCIASVWFLIELMIDSTQTCLGQVSSFKTQFMFPSFLEAL